MERAKEEVVVEGRSRRIEYVGGEKEKLTVVACGRSDIMLINTYDVNNKTQQ